MDFLFEQPSREVHLLRDIASVDLDLNDVVFLLPEVELVHLGGGDDSDHSGVLFDTFQIYSRVVLLGIFGEGFFLGLHPVFVEPSQSVLVQLLAPHSR